MPGAAVLLEREEQLKGGHCTGVTLDGTYPSAHMVILKANEECAPPARRNECYIRDCMWTAFCFQLEAGCQLGTKLLTSVHRAHSLPSSAHHGLCEATNQLVGGPHRKPAVLILQPAARLLAAGRVPDKRHLLPHSHQAHSHSSPLQTTEAGYTNKCTCQ
jgi:hypothetical protein